jgi:hypothetical protein
VQSYRTEGLLARRVDGDAPACRPPWPLG